MLGHGVSKAKVFLVTDQASEPCGGGGSGGRAAAISISMGEQRKGNSAGRSAGLLAAASSPSRGESERRAGDAVEAPTAVGLGGKNVALFSFF
jgi:hypothetical protein